MGELEGGDRRVNGGKGEGKEGRKARRNAVRPQERGSGDAGREVPTLGEAEETLGQRGKVSPGLERSPKLASSSSQA